MYTDGGVIPCLGNRRRRSEWQGQIFDRKLLNSRFVRMRSENMPKTRLSCCQIATMLAPL